MRSLPGAASRATSARTRRRDLDRRATCRVSSRAAVCAEQPLEDGAREFVAARVFGLERRVMIDMLAHTR